MVPCMNAAAHLYGFDMEQDDNVHVLDPGVRMRPTAGLVVHQRVGAPLERVNGRLATAPAGRRSRSLAHFGARAHWRLSMPHYIRCRAPRRPGITPRFVSNGDVAASSAVRELLEHADARAESAMESEARLVFIDCGLPLPELQYEILEVRMANCGESTLHGLTHGWQPSTRASQWHAESARNAQRQGIKIRASPRTAVGQ